MYFMSVAKKEFNNVYRDIIISKDTEIIPVSSHLKNNTFSFDINNNNNFEKDVLYYENKKNKAKIDL
jgi:hypothetical protein